MSALLSARLRACTAAACAALSVAACGQRQPSGHLEPIRLVQGVFHEDALPPTSSEGPGVTGVEIPGTVLTVGQPGRLVTGRVDEEAFAIAVRLGDLGAGYWLQPVEGFDPAFPGERTFQLELDVGGGVPTGLHDLRLVAIDEAGRAGEPFEVEVCVVDDTSGSGLSVCDDTLEPPHTVVSLVWDADVDLDLVAITPSGKRVDARHPTTIDRVDGAPISAGQLADSTVGVLVRDSNAGCILDGRNAERLEWRAPPLEGGAFNVYADLFDGCGEAAVTFVLSVYRRETREDGTFRLVEETRREGQLQRLAGRGGATQPLYLTTVIFD
jgi:hypothetical protein